MMRLSITLKRENTDRPSGASVTPRRTRSTRRAGREMVAKAQTGTRSRGSATAGPHRRRTGGARRVTRKASVIRRVAPGDLGVTTSCRTRACNRARLRGSRLAYRRYDFATLRRNPGNARRLSSPPRGLATSAAIRQAQPMTSEPMSLGRHSNSSLARSTRFVPDCLLEGDGFDLSVKIRPEENCGFPGLAISAIVPQPRAK